MLEQPARPGGIGHIRLHGKGTHTTAGGFVRYLLGHVQAADAVHNHIGPLFGQNPGHMTTHEPGRARDQHALARCDEAQLMQRAYAVRVAVEDVIELHLCL